MYFKKELSRTGVTRLLLSPAKLLEVDFASDVLHYADPSTGELIPCPVYVAVLPFSGYGYMEALPDAKLAQVVKALNHTINYFWGVPLTVKSDNMRQWVSKSCNYEVRIAYDQDTVEVYYEGQRIAVHTRNYTSHGYTTIKDHMPERHQAICSNSKVWP
ncbi:hypothetical protein ACTHQF_00195 [Pedobacter sp. SAFR-022]|uniref:hypothetical protein n=1 Tax=Pedobacter sp. SAFR-022 TaxID=3436861 RepID=UPI003F809534